MNFNLISPTSNAHDYVIKFKEPITIDDNSKVSLNFLELKRKGEIVLLENNTIVFTSTKLLPTHLPSAPGTANTMNFLVSITKGVYSYDDLQDHIQDQIKLGTSNKI